MAPTIGSNGSPSADLALPTRRDGPLPETHATVRLARLKWNLGVGLAPWPFLASLRAAKSSGGT